ncbi:MAG: hypothetical protein AAGC93_23335 [Cyanobacteria bacterium P01_F01_bin.53]
MPDFAVITGLNGSGKTHLMRAIKAGHVTVDAIPVHEIGYYTYKDFLVPNDSTLNNQQIESHRQQTWQWFTGTQGNPRINWRQQLTTLHTQNFVITENGQQIDLLARDLPKDVSIWEADNNPSLVDDALATRIDNYVTALRQQVFAQANFKKIPHCVDLIKALRKTDSFLHLINEEDFQERFVPSVQTTNHLATSLGVIFTKYKINQFLWAHRQFDAGDCAKTKNEPGSPLVCVRRFQ